MQQNTIGKFNVLLHLNKDIMKMSMIFFHRILSLKSYYSEFEMLHYEYSIVEVEQ